MKDWVDLQIQTELVGSQNQQLQHQALE